MIGHGELARQAGPVERPELPGVVQIFVSFEIQVVTGMGFNFRYIK